jgi:heme exporter protein C
MLFIYIIPRLTDSLHPGNGGNPAFSKYDLDSSLRMFFYPASIGWILLGFWIMSLLVRIQFVRQKLAA